MIFLVHDLLRGLSPQVTKLRDHRDFEIENDAP